MGLMPKSATASVMNEMSKWQTLGVEGHFTEPLPWVSVGEQCIDSLARLVGAEPAEVAVMNTLTVNLHLMMISFYHPMPTSASSPST